MKAPAVNADDDLEKLAHHDITMETLAEIRTDAAQLAAETGLDDDRSAQFALAVTEVATNTVRHGGGQGALDILRDDERALYAGVSDQGPGGAAVPAEKPPPDAVSGRGLWISKELTDNMRIDSGEDGTTVRLEMSLGETPSPPDAPAEDR
jgi:serine/threonine-protein kinase RsbW